MVQGRFEKYNSRPGKSYFVWSRVGGAESDTGCDGETAWEITPSKGPRIIEGAERESKIRDSIFDFELQWLDYFKEIHCTGIEVIDERPCYRVVMVPPKGPPETRFFDVESSLLIGEDVPSATDKSKVTQVRYGKYETVDGVALPREIRQSSSTLEVLYAIQSYEQNAEIPAYKLELPAVIKVMKKRMEAKPPEPSKPGKPG